MSIFANKISRISTTVPTASKIPVCAQKVALTPVSASRRKSASA